jgi:hypothetical protein
MTVFEKISCPKCGALRNPDLTKPCELCNSRKIPLLGYTYGLELSYVVKILIVLFVIILCAFIVGAIVIFWWAVNLQSASLSPALGFIL